MEPLPCRRVSQSMPLQPGATEKARYRNYPDYRNYRCMSSYFFSLGRVPSLVFEEDVEDLGLVLQTLGVPQQLGQGAVVDGTASVSGDAALCAHHHLWDLQGGGGSSTG